MADNNGFIDPLENIINKTKEAYGIPDDTPTPTVSKIEPPVVEEPVPVSKYEKPITPPVQESYDVEEEDDDPYGKNDLMKQIEEEDRAREAQKQAEIDARLEREAKNAKKVEKMPPRSLDPEFQRDAVDFQANHLAVVTGMIEKVKAKYHLVGGIRPESQRHVEGDLLEIYYKTGDQITPQFEKIILDNWQHVDPGTGEAYPQNNGIQQTPGGAQEAPKKQEEATININVQPDTDVTVNIDGETVKELTKTNVINVHVREVTNEEMKAVTVIENPLDEGLIQTYETSLNDVPITLPMSGYKCKIKPVNWFETIDLVAPSSNSKIDFQLQRWSIIYNHMTNVSIGAFKNFDDFLRKTKYADLSILEWAILVATADEEESLDITCGNPKCQAHYSYTYRPREIIHLNEERIPKKYHEVHNAAPGNQAVQLFNEINSKKRRYQLPTSKLIVEIEEPSAYDYITKTLPLIIKKYTEKRPNDPEMNDFNEETLQGDPTLMSFSYRVACMMRISAIVIPDKNNPTREYRFTDWEDIERQIDSIKIMKDSMLIMKLAMDSRDMAEPAEFYLENVACPHCGRVDKVIPITNITQSLLFRISRRLEDMELNLINLD